MKSWKAAAQATLRPNDLTARRRMQARRTFCDCDYLGAGLSWLPIKEIKAVCMTRMSRQDAKT